jgi:hypothetical protein
MKTIIIHDLTNVTVDDVPQGGVVDVLFHAASVGDETLRAPLLDALLQRESAAADAAKADNAAALETAKAEAQAQYERAMQEVQAQSDAKFAEATARDAANTAEINALTAGRDTLKAALTAEQAHHTSMMDRIKAGWSEVTAHFERHATNVSEATTTLSERTQAERAARKQQLLEEAAKL